MQHTTESIKSSTDSSNNVCEPLVFVTVGTTQFEGLIDISNSAEFHAHLWHLGYRRLTVQYGRGSIEPKPPLTREVERIRPDCQPLSLVEAFRLKSSIKADLAASSLVISHGGAGSCIEALSGAVGSSPSRPNRRLIIVVNPFLMENHQQELADQLMLERYALSTTPDGLLRLLKSGLSHTPDQSWPDVEVLLDPSKSPSSVGFHRYQRGNPRTLATHLEAHLASARGPSYLLPLAVLIICSLFLPAYLSQFRRQYLHNLD